MVASCPPPTGDLDGNSGMCLDWELNQRPFGSQARTQSSEPHQPGLFILIIEPVFSEKYLCCFCCHVCFLCVCVHTCMHVKTNNTTIDLPVYVFAHSCEYNWKKNSYKQFFLARWRMCVLHFTTYFQIVLAEVYQLFLYNKSARNELSANTLSGMVYYQITW